MNEAQTPTPDGNQYSNSPKRTGLPAWVVAVATIVIFAAGAAAGYWYWVKPPQPQPQNQNKPAETAESQKSGVASTTAESAPEAKNRAGTCQTYTPTTRQLSGQIAWLEPVKIEALDIIKPAAGSGASDYVRTNSKFYKVGGVISGKYSGFEVILADIAQEGMAGYSDYFRFFKKGDRYVMLGKYSPELKEWDELFNLSKISIDNSYDVSDLDYPKTFQGVTGRENFELNTYDISFFCADDLQKVFTHAILGDVYTSQNKSNAGTGGTKPRYGFYLEAPDGTYRSYSFAIDFMGKDNVPHVNWGDGTKNSAEYTYTDIGGCGSTNYLSVMTPDRVNPETDLAEAGSNSFGDKIYSLKNSNHPLLKDIYDNQYSVYQGEKISYDEFVKSRPVFFWRDPFGRLVKFQNNKFVPQAECGKPVIYLYPETAEKVSVKLEPKGGFSYSEPAYGSGWNVIARPDGELREISTGKNYPYLFWEGRGGLYQRPKQGFVISQGEVDAFLKDKLTKLGLNEKERADFIEFWAPKMKDSPYYFVTFLGNDAMNAIAPLTVEPKPDTIIRVLMDFTPLDKPIEAEGFSIKTPARKGFTVVEWGGVLRGGR